MMSKQMELFEEGGLKDEGGMIDEESGNKVPVGSTREEVRDDIPAKLSEGEFVMPADVVRYHGLDKMMALRDEAKMGLSKMEAMGQMGNSDEATLPEGLPFGMADLIVIAEDGNEVEMAEGGYVTMANGGDPSANVRQLGATYTPPTNQPINFTQVMGSGNISYKEYRNAEGKNILVAFIGGVPLYPIPEGYTEYTPGENEPITPIQEIVQASPPTPVAEEEDRQRAGYEEGYFIGIENMTADQLIEENRRRNSPFAKLAMAVVTVMNPLIGMGVAAAVKQNKDKSQKRAEDLKLTKLAAEIKNEKSLLDGVFSFASQFVPKSISKIVPLIRSVFTGERVTNESVEDAKNSVDAETGRPIRRPVVTSPTGVPITGGIQPESRADITPAVSGSGGQINPYMAALMGGYNANQKARADGTLPSGVQVASAGELTNEQLRQIGQGYMTAGDRYAMGYGGRGLQGSRPEGFGSQDLGYDPTVDPRGPSQIPASRRPFPNYAYESNMRDRNMRPPSGTPKFYDAFGNETISMGQGSSRESTDIPFDSGTRYVQDFIDDAASADANVARIPYADPGAYTFAPPFGRQDAMGQFPASPINVVPRNMQGPNFTPDSIDPRGPSQIPDSRRPFEQSVPYDASFPREPAVPANVISTQPVGTQMLPKVGGTSGRLQDFRGGDPFKPLRGAGIGGSNMGTPDNVTDISTPATIEATGPTTSNYGTQTFNAFGEGVNPSLPVGQLPLYDASFEREPAVPANVPVPANLNLASMSQFDLEQASLDGNEAASNELRARNELENQAALRESGLDMPSITPNISRVPSVGQEEFSELKRSIPDPRGPSQIPDSVRPFPKTTTKVSDSQLTLPDNTMFGTDDLQDVPELDLMFGTDDLKTTTTQPVDDTKKPKTPAKTFNMFGDEVIKGEKGSDEYLFDRTEVAAKEKAYKDRVNSKEFDTRGRDTLLRSGKVVPKNSAMAVYNREQEETGYIGTDAEGYGVGMIAGPGSAGVVVDADGKAKKTPDRKTIFQDSKGVQYTKSTFGKRETLDGKAYTPAEGAKRGDGADRDNDGEADEAKIICTAMNASYGFGSYRQAIWLNYSNKHLTKAHEVGYHTLFLPLVHLAYTKNNKLIRKILEHGTRRRTADLRAELKGTKRNTLGRFYRSIFEPLCYGVGKIKMAFGE